jgi:hypothetical protein
VEHTILEMLSERVYGLALGYEDINDHEELRRDPLFGILAGREEPAPPAEIVLDMDTTDLPLHGKQEGRFFHGYYDSYAIFRSMSSAETMYCARVCANPVTMQRTVV